jgi:hypothetical protein
VETWFVHIAAKICSLSRWSESVSKREKKRKREWDKIKQDEMMEICYGLTSIYRASHIS